MRKSATFIAVLCLAVLCFVVSLLWAGKSADKLTFKNAGFSIAPLDEPQKGLAQVLMMFLPASNGFAPNVNVQIQPYTDGIDAYAALSKGQFKNYGFKLLSESKPDKLTLTFEYNGLFNGKSFHWYAKAVQNGETICLATAAATEEQWPLVAANLKACIDSFETLKNEPAHVGDMKTNAK